jgi:hypothetical protein
VSSLKPKFGTVLPTRGLLFSKSSGRQDIIDLRRLAEKYGYDAVLSTRSRSGSSLDVLPSFSPMI